MASNAKKQSFLGGAAILASAVAIVKIVGAVYRIPVNNLLSAQGKTYFKVAYDIFNVLMTVSTAGLPLAISKLTSRAHATGRENEVRKLFRTVIWLFLAMGLIGSLLMFFGASQLAGLQRQPMAAPAIRALAPTILCVSLLACMRGYTQGQGNMTPTAVSQVIEVTFKLGVGLPLAWYFIRVVQKGVSYGAAGAIFGVTVSEVIALIFMALYLIRHRDRRVLSNDVPPSGGTLMKQVLAIGIPITLSNSAMSLLTMLDTTIVLRRLYDIAGQLPAAPGVLFGQYGYSTDLVNLPPSFVFPVTMSLIPFVAAALAQKDNARANRVVSSAFRLIALLAIPAGIGLSVLSKPILLLLYPAQAQDALACAPLLQVQGIACIFICLMNLTNAILQSYGKERIPIWTMVTGGVTKIVMNYFLVGNPNINIMGAPISTLCCYSVIAGLNLYFVWKYSPEKPRYLSIFAKPAMASVLMGTAAWASHGLLTRMIGEGSYFQSAFCTLLAICAAVLVYGILVVALRILRAEDLESIPHGKKLAKILRLK